MKKVKQIMIDIFFFIGGFIILCIIGGLILFGCKKESQSSSAPQTTANIKLDFQYWRTTNDSAYIGIPCLPAGQQYYYTTTSRQWTFQLQKKNQYYTIKAQTWNYIDSMQTTLYINGVLTKQASGKNINTIVFQY